MLICFPEAILIREGTKMNVNIRVVTCGALKVAAVLLIIPVFIALCIWLPGYGDIYETATANDYGKITGNFDNETPAAFIHSFFPEELEDSFSSIVYHYKAKKGDAFAYECYLEFIIEDADAYFDFTERYIDRNLSTTFVYDADFQEQSFSNVLDLQTPRASEAVYPISAAEIGKVLFSDEQQRLVFVAIGMHDGGGANTVEFGHFFSRFQIDPWEYMQNAYATPYYQELDIPNKDMQCEFPLNSR